MFSREWRSHFLRSQEGNIQSSDVESFCNQSNTWPQTVHYSSPGIRTEFTQRFPLLKWEQWIILLRFHVPIGISISSLIWVVSRNVSDQIDLNIWVQLWYLMLIDASLDHQYKEIKNFYRTMKCHSNCCQTFFGSRSIWGRPKVFDYNLIHKLFFAIITTRLFP